MAQILTDPPPVGVSMAAESKGHKGGLALTFSDLGVTLVDKKGGKVAEKAVLQHVSGCLFEGELLAIIGPSGAGKTTCLDALAQRVQASSRVKLHGSVRAGGRELNRNVFKQMAAYVEQEDSLWDTFTVRENIEYAACFQLPAKTSRGEINAKVDSVLSLLGLQSCADVRVGGPFVRGISGGQKRRTSIALVMVNTPEMLFLDEPTSGLDSAGSHAVMETVRILANGNSSSSSSSKNEGESFTLDMEERGGEDDESGVGGAGTGAGAAGAGAGGGAGGGVVGLGARRHLAVCSIHQPSSRILAMFDKVLVLSMGQVAFFGHQQDMLPHFSGLGHDCGVRVNPAEFVLDLVNADFTSTTEVRRLLDAWDQSPHDDSDTAAAATAAAAAAAEAGAAGAGAVAEAGAAGAGAAAEAGAAGDGDGDGSEAGDGALRQQHGGGYTLSAWHQATILIERSVRNYSRDPTAYLFRFPLYIIMYTVLGSAYWDLNTTQNEVQDRVALVAFIFAGSSFLSVAAVPAFTRDILSVSRERMNGWYRCSTYALTCALVQLPFVLLVAVVVFTPVSFMATLKTDAEPFFRAVLILFSFLYCCESVLWVVSILMDNPVIAIGNATNILAGFFLFSGFFLRRDNIPDYWIWLHYLTPHKYGYEMMLRNEFEERTFIGVDAQCGVGKVCYGETGEEVLASMSPHYTDFSYSHWLILLWTLSVGWRLLGYWALRRRTGMKK